MQLYKTSRKLYLITRFILRRPELMTIVDMVGKYYRWFNVSSKTLKDDLILEFIDEYLKKSAWIYTMKRQILTWKKALYDLILCLETIENEGDIYNGMVSLLHHLYHVKQNCANLNNTDQISLIFQTNIHFTMMTTTRTDQFRYIQASNFPWVHNLFQINYYPWEYFLQSVNFF